MPFSVLRTATLATSLRDILGRHRLDQYGASARYRRRWRVGDALQNSKNWVAWTIEYGSRF